MSAGGARGHRSWHPSPFASDDDVASAAEEPQFYKEEKKNRIKMEIARRRQQIEENACLHDELTRLAKLRETAEITDRLNHPVAVGSGGAIYGPAVGAATMGATAAAAGVYGQTGVGAPYGQTAGVAPFGVSPGISPAVVSTAVNNPHLSHHAAMRTDSSVLKSVDEILRDGIGATPAIGVGGVPGHDPYARGGGVYGAAAGQLPMNAHHDPYHPHPHHPNTAFDRVTDFSPINSDMSDMGQYNRYGGAGARVGYGPAHGGVHPQGPHPGHAHSAHTMAQGYDATGRLNPSRPQAMMPHYK